VQFTTSSAPLFICGSSAITDYDGNIYKTVQIGTQCWMRENLATTHYADGTALVDGVAAVNIVGNYTSQYWFVYGNNMTNKATYGLLYTWAAIMNGAASSNISPSGVQGVCPTGWHVSSHAEWDTLDSYLGGGSVAGGKLKEAGTAHWNSPNTAATNVSGFTALPGGYRNGTGTFVYLGHYGIWFTATEDSTTNAWDLYLYYNYPFLDMYPDNKVNGFSVRCLKDY
jgi:uncharacterized protein (TIGR02145 family)